MSPEELSVYATGDVIPSRPNSETLFDLALPTIKKADILFGQLEANLSEKGERQTAADSVRKVSPERASALAFAGFDVMSFASNHTLDRGVEALLETLDTLEKNRIAVIGAGRNIAEARKPLILERKGTKVGFLAYCSVLPTGYGAGPNRPGSAPLRASTYYEQVDWQPGTPPRIITLANKDDLAAMLDDIARLRPLVDVLILSMHWGIHHVPAMIAMYQKEVGHAAIDAGVDLILGHHAHILKGIEVYKGKVVFYSLCNFVMPSSGAPRSRLKAHYHQESGPEYLEYDFPIDSRKTILAKCLIANRKIEKVSYLPIMINKHAQPEILSHSDNRSSEVYNYVDWCCRDQELEAKFSWEGDEVLIHT